MLNEIKNVDNRKNKKEWNGFCKKVTISQEYHKLNLIKKLIVIWMSKQWYIILINETWILRLINVYFICWLINNFLDNKLNEDRIKDACLNVY